MNYKISGGIRRNKKVFIVGIVLWLILAIVLVLPFTYATHIAGQGGGFDLTEFIDSFSKSAFSPVNNPS